MTKTVLVEHNDHRLVRIVDYSINTLVVERKRLDALGNPAWTREWSENLSHHDRHVDAETAEAARPLVLLLRTISNHEAREARLQRSQEQAESELVLTLADLKATEAELERVRAALLWSLWRR